MSSPLAELDRSAALAASGALLEKVLKLQQLFFEAAQIARSHPDLEVDPALFDRAESAMLEAGAQLTIARTELLRWRP